MRRREGMLKRYRLKILPDDTMQAIFTVCMPRWGWVTVAVMAVSLLLYVAFLVVVNTPLYRLLPGYLSSGIREQIAQNALRADSLEMVIQQQKLYVMNIQDIFKGEIRVDTVHSIDSLTILRSDDLMERTANEEEFVRQFEEQEKYNLTNVRRHSDVDGLIFYCPTQGLRTTVFNPFSRHYGVDITANAHANVLAVLDGTVIMTTHSAEKGFIVAIQHSKDFVSVYKHCGSLLKQVGDKVAAGEVIALVAAAGLHAADPHLHFELWRKGEPLNPEKFILF